MAGMLQRAPSISAEQKRANLLAEVHAFTDKVGKIEVWRIANFDMVPVEPEVCMYVCGKRGVYVCM